MHAALRASWPSAPETDLAEYPRRAAAYFVDLLITVPMFLAGVIVGDALNVVPVILASFAILPLYFTLMNGGRRGQTIGKRALGIRVFRTSGERAGYWRAFKRVAGRGRRLTLTTRSPARRTVAAWWQVD